MQMKREWTFRPSGVRRLPLVVCIGVVSTTGPLSRR
jgi:hypothetical protein